MKKLKTAREIYHYIVSNNSCSGIGCGRSSMGGLNEINCPLQDTKSGGCSIKFKINAADEIVAKAKEKLEVIKKLEFLENLK